MKKIVLSESQMNKMKIIKSNILIAESKQKQKIKNESDEFVKTFNRINNATILK